MRDDERHWHWSASVALMVVIGVAFVVQQISYRVFPATSANGVPPTDALFALSADGLKHGYVWQLLTFQFLHSGLWHLAGNLLGIWFFGRFIEDRLGKAAFFKIYFASGLIGGLLQGLLGLIPFELFASRFDIPVVGASAGVVGLLAAFAMLEPDAQILLWFVLPIKARHFLYFSLGFAAFLVIVPSDTAMAHGAHLGGLLTGMAIIRWRLYARTPDLDWLPQRAQRRQPQFVKTTSYGNDFWPQPVEKKSPEELAPEEFISRQVDPILDKISAHGIQSLTDRERKILDAARKKMAKR